MTSENTEDEKNKRITVNLEDIDFKIVEALEGVIARKKASVITQMIKEWINQNSDRIMKTWDIDLAGIRRQVLAETKGLSIKEELQDLDKEVIKQLPELFETINSINVNELAEIVDINQRTLQRIIFGHRKELLKLGLNLIYQDGLITKKE
jgi:mevalonate kinase